MTAIQAVLLAEELDSLHKLSRGPTRKRIPAEHGETLVRCGFAKIRDGTLAITVTGHAKLVLEITRFSWLFNASAGVAKGAETMDEIVGFDELRWLRELSFKAQNKLVPEVIKAKLLVRGLIERTTVGFALTARGRIALAKLG
jgi:hypothetical protein